MGRWYSGFGLKYGSIQSDENTGKRSASKKLEVKQGVFFVKIE